MTAIKQRQPELALSPYQKARELHKKEETSFTFANDTAWYLEHGYVISNPEAFALFRAVHSDGLVSSVVGRETFSTVNCWHVHLFAGNFRKLKDLFPFRLYYLSFEKRNEIRFYLFDALDRIEGLVK